MAGKSKTPLHLPPNQVAALHAVRDAMEVHYKKHVTIEEHARHAGMNESLFKLAFKSLFGLPPYKYFRSLRMEKAKALLLGTEDSVKSIGIQVGYPDWKSFMRAFKNTYGVTPTEWRQSHCCNNTHQTS